MDYVLYVVVFVVIMLLLRAFGAWMLRIDDVIDLLRKILKELRERDK